MSAPIEGVVGDLPPALAQDHEEGPESPLQKDSSAPTYSSDDDVPAFLGRNRKQSPIHRGTEKSRERSRSPLGERTRSLSPPSNNDIRDYFMVKTKSKYNTIVTTPPPNVAPQVGHIHEPEDLAMGEPEPYSTKRSRSPGEDRPKKHQAIEGLDTDSSEEADHSASEDTSELESSQSEEEDKDQKETKTDLLPWDLTFFRAACDLLNEHLLCPACSTPSPKGEGASKGAYRLQCQQCKRTFFAHHKLLLPTFVSHFEALLQSNVALFSLYNREKVWTTFVKSPAHIPCSTHTTEAVEIPSDWEKEEEDVSFETTPDIPHALTDTHIDSYLPTPPSTTPPPDMLPEPTILQTFSQPNPEIPQTFAVWSTDISKVLIDHGLPMELFAKIMAGLEKLAILPTPKVSETQEKVIPVTEPTLANIMSLLQESMKKNEERFAKLEDPASQSAQFPPTITHQKTKTFPTPSLLATPSFATRISQAETARPHINPQSHNVYKTSNPSTDWTSATTKKQRPPMDEQVENYWLGSADHSPDLCNLRMKGLLKGSFQFVRSGLRARGIPNSWVKDMIWIKDDVLELVVLSSKRTQIAEILNKVKAISIDPAATLYGNIPAMTTIEIQQWERRTAHQLERLPTDSAIARHYVAGQNQKAKDELKRRNITTLRNV
jgi:hypothetical protein